MTTQLLIYETAVPVSWTRHGEVSVEAGADYGFARHVNSVPLMAVEFPHAAAEYAIVFAGTAEAVMPAVILGVRRDHNMFLDEKAAWQGRYIPAFIRRYPFVFSGTDDGKSFTLCIDEAYAGLNRAGRGERLFDAEGKPTPYTENVLKFLQEYQTQFRRTQIFCQKLKALDLLEPMQAQITTGGGERTSLTGFMAINRNRLKALSGEVLAELAKTDELELIYLHLQSMQNFGALRDRLAAGAAQAQAAAVAQTGVSAPGSVH